MVKVKIANRLLCKFSLLVLFQVGAQQATAACPKLIDTFPSGTSTSGYTLSRTVKPIFRLLFDSDITTPSNIQIKKLLANGAYDSVDVGGSFTITSENDPGGVTSILKIEAASQPLTDRAWYSVKGTVASGCPFEFKFGQVAGDANNDRRVNTNDLAFVNSRVSAVSGVPWSWSDTTKQNRFRANVNADNFVNANDLSAVNSRINATAVNPPSGHTVGIQTQTTEEELRADIRMLEFTGYNADGTENWQIIPEGREIELGLRVKFDGSLSTGNIGAYNWLFGDGTTHGGEANSTAMKAYANSGKYTIRLLVYNQDFTDSKEATRTLNVGDGVKLLGRSWESQWGGTDLAMTNDPHTNRRYAWILSTAQDLNGQVLLVDANNTENLEVLAEYEADERSTRVAEGSGMLFFAAGDAGLVTYRITYPSQNTNQVPTFSLVSRYATFAADRQRVHDVFAVGSMVLIAAGEAGLKILDMSQPSAPRLIAQVDLGDIVRQVWAKNGIAYAIAGDGRLHALHIGEAIAANPDPELWSVPSGWWMSRGWTVSENVVAIVRDKLYLYTHDANTSQPPVLMGAFPLAVIGNRSDVNMMFVRNERLYLSAAATGGLLAELIVVNISDKRAPYLMQRLLLGVGAQNEPFIDDQYLFVADESYGLASFSLGGSSNP